MEGSSSPGRRGASGTAARPPFLTLDISRLLSRAGAAVPTGIDRVELAWAEYLLQHARDRLEFVALHPLGRFGSLPFAHSARFVSALAARWDAGRPDDGEAAGLGRRLLHGMMLPRMMRRGGGPGRAALAGRERVYLLLSHHHLTRPDVVEEALRQRNARFVPMVHDLIPLQFPEYSRPKEPAKHATRIDTVARLADAVIVPSEAVRQALLPHLRECGRDHVPVWTVRHGVHLRAVAKAVDPDADVPVAEPPSHPYFVCLGTIEARKNHLLLLTIWRRLVEQMGAAAPRLVLIGKRGWENEQVLDMLERCPALQDVVTEHNALPDSDVVRLLRGARALLFPSFAEGYGLPLGEALSLGVPTICADIPVFREVGGDVPLFLDPLDGTGWIEAVRSFTGTDSPREEQRLRLDDWSVADWPASVAEAMGLIEVFGSEPAPGGTASRMPFGFSRPSPGPAPPPA